MEGIVREVVQNSLQWKTYQNQEKPYHFHTITKPDYATDYAMWE